MFHFFTPWIKLNSGILIFNDSIMQLAKFDAKNGFGVYFTL